MKSNLQNRHALNIVSESIGSDAIGLITKKKSLLLISIISLFYANSALAWNYISDRLQNVPNSFSPPSVLIQGDEWTFLGGVGQQVTIKADTRDDFGNNTSGLDAVAVLKDPHGNVLAWADDNAACSVDQVCGYSCPEITYTLPVTGKYTIVVRDYDHASTTGQQCNGGSYHLTVRSDILPYKTLSKAPSVDNGIVGDPSTLQRDIAFVKGTLPAR